MGLSQPVDMFMFLIQWVFLTMPLSKGRCVVGVPDLPSERRTFPSVFGLAVRKEGGNSHTFHSLQGMSVIVREVKLLSRSSWDVLAVDCNKAVVMYRLYNTAVNVNELSWNGVNIRFVLNSEAPSVSMFILLIAGTLVSVRITSNSTILVLDLWQTLPCYFTYKDLTCIFRCVYISLPVTWSDREAPAIMKRLTKYTAPCRIRTEFADIGELLYQSLDVKKTIVSSPCVTVAQVSFEIWIYFVSSTPML